MPEEGFQQEENCERGRVSTEKILLVEGFQQEENYVRVWVSTRGELC